MLRGVRFVAVVGSICGVFSMTALAQGQVRVVSSPPAQRGALYISNRAPLAPSPLVKLPIGAITPKGWLRHQLQLEARGMHGQLHHLSRWCSFEGNAWADPEGKGHSGWEEMPYWLKGYGDLGYVLKDEAIIAHARKWIEAILASQREDGWFGPRELLTSLDGKPDFWPNMIALNVLQSYHEVTGDPRVPALMTRYFRWQLDFPEEAFLTGYWPKIRAGDNLESIYWLYNRTGEAWLLELAKKVHRRTADWTSGVINWHGVNICQGFREPTIFWMQSSEERHLRGAERNYRQVMELYGQVPGGMFGADENARPGYAGPRQAAEACSMVEFTHSFQMLTKITADVVWADRCEDVAFNSLPAALTADLKALHYLTAPNQVLLDRHNKSPGVQNGGTMFSYSPYAVYRCCQHNVAHGWPYYAEELWLATSDRGLCASLYAASEVTARVGDGSEVILVEETDYPFSDTITLKLKMAGPVSFPLYFRIPGWCSEPAVTINSTPVKVDANGGGYLVIEREWSDGDAVVLRLPMRVSVRKWAKNHDSVSIDYGPLTFSLAIGEKWVPYGGSEQWPELEVHPTTAWNYGLVLDDSNPAASVEVVRQDGPLAEQPFTPETAPIRLRARGRRIPAWMQDPTALIHELQQSPARSSEPVEMVTLIPMGAARLRISAFPTVGEGAGAHQWKTPPPPPLASHCFAGDTVLALNDGRLPRSSGDRSIPRFTWWDHRGTREWVQYDFDAPRRVGGVDVYWFDDAEHNGHCRAPRSWRVLYRQQDQWKPVANATAYTTELHRFNRVTFDPVETDAIRLEAQLLPEFSAGILEWRVLE